METNSFLFASPTGKLTAFVVAVLMSFSSFTLLASGDYEEQATVVSEAAMLENWSAVGTEALGVTDEAPLGVAPDDMLPQPVKVQAGKFSPVRADPGDAKILVMDDDAEFWMSGPWLEATHIETALNDGGFSFDVFRAGFWEQVDRGLPSGDAGLDIVDDYEAIIWYGGWNGRAYVNAQEQNIMMDYLDGECSTGGNGFCTTNRNIIHVTQMGDWFHSYGGAAYRGGYIHYDTRGGLIVDGTSNPLKGVDDSIFDGKEYNTDELGVHYLDRPVGAGTAATGPAMGAFHYDALSTTTAPYHAIQFPRTDVPPSSDPGYKSLYFGTEIGCIGGREDRADFFTTMLDWMEVDSEAKKNVDVGIGGLHIPNHSQYWRTVESMVPVQIETIITNYGNLEQSHTGAHLQLKNQFGQILFDNTFDTAAFVGETTGYDTNGDGQYNEPHPMAITSLAPHGLAGDSVQFTFNRTNDALQLEHDQKDPSKSRDVIFTSAGMDFLSVSIVHAGDQVPSNNYVQASVGVSKWVDNGEPTCAPNQQTRWYDRCETGATLTFGDTGANNANSLEYVNYHRGHSYDFDSDGCGWARPMTDSGCAGGAGTANESLGMSEMEGMYALDGYRAQGWYKSTANTADGDGDGWPDACDWEDYSDKDCPKFTPEPWQDDFAMSPSLDMSAMEEVIIGMVFSGCMESGDYFRMQISKDNGATWTSLISYTNFCVGKGAWYLWGGGNARYQGYVLASTYYGKEDTDNVRFRIMQDNEGDQITEQNGRAATGWYVDEITFRGTEKVSRDLAMENVAVREEGFIVKSKTDDLQREINATVLNAGEAGWSDVPVVFSATNLQGDDLDGMLDETDAVITDLPGDSSYGNIDAEGYEDQKDLFVLFSASGPNTYTITVEVRALRADFFPWNNTKSVTFRIFDTFFYDPVDSQPGKDDIEYTEFESTSMVDNFWNTVTASSAGVGSSDAGNDGTRIYRYYDGSDGYSGGADSHSVTPDACTRSIGGQPVTDVCIDLRAAFDPILQFYVMWELQPGDRFEVRAATNFDSLQQTSGTWTVLKDYGCSSEAGCSSGTWDSGGWVDESISLAAFEGYQTWIDFRVVTSTGGSGGILIDDISVIGNEYRYNLAVTDVDTTHFGAAGKEHDLSIEVKNVGLKDQDDVVVSAQITDVNGQRVWPSGTPYTEYTIQDTTLSKGDTFTVDPESAGDAWKWGLGLDPGIYTLRVIVRGSDPLDHPDENPSDDRRNITLVLGATLLDGDSWSGDWSGNEGTWSWDSSSGSGDLNSDSFDIWNSKPFLVVESSFDLTDSYVQAQVKVGSQWYDVKWRDATLEASSLYAIPGNNYTELPTSWTGSSQFDGQGKHAFYADLGVVEDISDGTSLQEQYVRGSMEIRLRGVSNDGSGNFKAFNPSVFGLNRYDVDVTGMTPTSQKAEPSSQLLPAERTYTVKVRNLGAVADSGVVDFSITIPDNSLVDLESGSLCVGCPVAKLDRILQRDDETVVAIKPTGGNWQDPSRYAEGDQTAYIGEDGEITWPSGNSEFTAAPGWKIGNPTKEYWHSSLDKPQAPTAGSMKDPGETLNVNVQITVGFATWAPPGTYTIQADARSWTDYGSTFTEGDVEGQATMTIDPPDLKLGDASWITHAIGMSAGANSGWSKTSGGEPHFSFEVEVLNSGTETVGTFKVGLLYLDGNPVGVDVGLFWTGSEWDIDTDETSATGAELRERGGRQFVYFRATASQLGMSAGPGDDISGTYVFYLAVDTEENIGESNENNNRLSVEITTIAEINTIPSFALAPLSMLASSLLAGLAIALRRKEEE
ncbi:uncharacterized protein METZ01_LOCUS58195 [marine metagenome]|uniref:CARDB domain-containing protein n=1 Tax=marine metagenome TaxID=408172 RepID=A0A381SPV1_9ZZZZ